MNQQPSLTINNLFERSRSPFWQAAQGFSVIALKNARGLIMCGMDFISVNGDLLTMIPAEEPFGWIPDDNQACDSFLQIEFQRDLLGSLGEQRLEFRNLQEYLKLYDHALNWPTEEQLCLKAISDLQDMDSLSQTLTLISLLNKFSSSDSFKIDCSSASKTPFKYWQQITPIMDIVCREYLNNVQIEDFSRETGMDNQKIFRNFKKAADETLLGFINRLRVERACRFMVIFPNEPVNDIARTCGFRNPVSFNKQFHRCKNQPPAQYKKYLQEKS